MRRTLMIVSLLLAACFSFACGERSTTTATNANAQSNTAGTQSTGATSGSGPKTEGIGGASNGNDGNTYTVPPGFNENGDRGSASNVRNAP
jgi:hypothetical protein